MADNTAIEWTDATWNPIRARNLKTGKVGWHCTHVSEGCRNCYAEGFNKRLGTGLEYKPGHERDIEIYLDDKALGQPLRWKNPRKVFTLSMSDMFADFVDDIWIHRMLGVMCMQSRHTFQILTKRPERMLRFFEGVHINYRNAPPSNIWLGVSVENQETADERIPLLLQTPAAKRFLSCEPLLGPVDLENALRIAWQCSRCRRYFSGRHKPTCPSCGQLGGWSGSHIFNPPSGQTGSGIDWVIAGGESGKGARPMHPDWARSLRDQCKAAGVPFFFKQWGEFGCLHQARKGESGIVMESGWHAVRVGKKRAGRLLDGVEHSEFPS